jgi:hypothetical protein
MTRIWQAVIMCIAMSLASIPVLADAIPDTYPTDLECSLDNDDYEADCVKCLVDNCKTKYASMGYGLECASKDYEIWCLYDDEETSCTVALKRNRKNFAAQLGLVVALVAFGLFVLRRSRS